MKTIWVLSIKNDEKDYPNLHVHQTYEEAHKTLAYYCRERWGGFEPESPDALNDDAIIRLYFSYWPDEDYVILRAETQED